MNSIVGILIHEPRAFEPMFLERVWKGKTIVVVDEWCEGYMRGVGLAADEWRAREPEIADLLLPIRAFTAAANWPGHELSEPQAAKLRDAIAPNVRALHAYWIARRERNTRSIARQERPSLRVGRNAPCPCGSGNKYKNCCLQ